MTDNTKILAVHKSRNILLDILKTRSYNIEDYSGFSINEIHALFVNKQLDILLTNNEERKIYVKYYLDKTIRPANVHDMIDDLFNIEQILTPNDDLIIIIKDEPNDTLQKLQNSIYEHDKIFITIINIDRLQFNILHHSLVPNHRVLSKEEAADIKTKYNIVLDSHIPGISRFDPVAQVLGIRPGELCEITRSSKTSITSKFYRFCSK
jgi:DNA-directed RNA polymerase subunit H (RpoH/RPB5)